METISNERTERLRCLRIVIVENHVDTLLTFSLYLQSLGHTVTLAKNMAEARAWWSSAPYDLLICDLRLPDGDGWELLEHELLPRPRHAIAISGLGSMADRARSQAAGFRHHLLKPFILAELDAALEEAAQELAPVQPVWPAKAA